MKIKIKKIIETEHKATLLECHVKPTIWAYEDKEEWGTISFPCRIMNTWNPIINIDTGIIVNWNCTRRAQINFKVEEEGVYTLMDSDCNKIKDVKSTVPKMLCQGSDIDGFIIMDIDIHGRIKDWVFNGDMFMKDDCCCNGSCK